MKIKIGQVYFADNHYSFDPCYVKVLNVYTNYVDTKIIKSSKHLSNVERSLWPYRIDTLIRKVKDIHLDQLLEKL